MYRSGKPGKSKVRENLQAALAKRFLLTYSKGYVYTIEVMLSVVTVVFVLVLIFSHTPEQPETSLAIIKQNGYSALSYLDMSGELRKIIQRNDTAALKNNITARIPSTIVFDVSICGNQCSSSLLPANRTVVNVDYFISGYQEAYLGKKVRLWMWQRF
jgi:hypothetical protein